MKITSQLSLHVTGTPTCWYQINLIQWPTAIVEWLDKNSSCDTITSALCLHLKPLLNEIYVNPRPWYVINKPNLQFLDCVIFDCEEIWISQVLKTAWPNNSLNLSGRGSGVVPGLGWMAQKYHPSSTDLGSNTGSKLARVSLKCSWFTARLKHIQTWQPLRDQRRVKFGAHFEPQSAGIRWLPGSSVMSCFYHL